MSERIDRTARAPKPQGGFPRWTPWLNAVAKPLLAAGVPLGPNGLITVRGRKSGLPRTTPVAIIEVSGRRWIWSPFGEEQWVRNLRAAGRASVTKRGRKEEVSATELDPTERVAFFRDILAPLARSIPLGVRFIRAADKFDLDHPVEEAAGRVVFELHRLDTALPRSSGTSTDTPDGRR
jgi:deazaflavin-dependent oxidoreductase (nitroreductase family)